MLDDRDIPTGDVTKLTDGEIAQAAENALARCKDPRAALTKTLRLLPPLPHRLSDGQREYASCLAHFREDLSTVTGLNFCVAWVELQPAIDRAQQYFDTNGYATEAAM